MNESQRILVIEDDKDIQRLLAANLQEFGLGVECCGRGDAGLDLAKSGNFTLVILDIMVPGMDGFEILRQLRASHSLIPVLVLTSRSEEVDRVLGLELGADDYLPKPFSVRELVARVRALLRRSKPAGEHSHADLLRFGNITIDTARRAVSVRDRPIELTAKEFDLLFYLATHSGRVFTRAELLNHVWGYESVVYEHTVTSHINRLRTKLEDDPGNPHYIQTARGVGYRFTENP